MERLDWIIILLYLIFALTLGFILARRGSRSLVDFFVSGRSLPWWLAGTSMAATTFSIDTPLYIAGVVGERGIAGNWEWWSFAFAHLILIYMFARLWRRSEVVTDAELTELRYGGQMAAILRSIKAFLFAVPINSIGIGYVMLAMVKVVEALQLWESLGFQPGEKERLISVIGVSLFVLLYAGLSGLWGVVTTDFLQFFLGLFGAVIVAVIAVNEVGGMHQLIPKVKEVANEDILLFIPVKADISWNRFDLSWSNIAGISLPMFSAYLFLQWWSFRRSDGGGEFIQRLASLKHEREAEKAVWLFNILHYLVRTWPWIVVALVALVLYPDLDDRELGYPQLMLDFLPSGMLGLVVASLVAAFMSTVSTSINWGASYLTNDLYYRFLRPQASQPELVLIARLASVIVTALGALTAFFAENVRDIFQLAIAIGTGPGLVLILRWFWWRINAAAELAALVSGFILGLVTTELVDDFGVRLIVISLLTAPIWITVMLITPPESDETLDEFYRRVRPSGWGWRRQQARTGIPPGQNLQNDILRVLAAILLLFGSMFAVGGFLLLQPLVGWISLIIGVIGGFWLRQLNKQTIKPMPRPGLEDYE